MGDKDSMPDLSFGTTAIDFTVLKLESRKFVKKQLLVRHFPICFFFSVKKKKRRRRGFCSGH